MAKIKITQLPELTNISNEDILLVVDDSSPFATKKIKWENIKLNTTNISSSGASNNQYLIYSSGANSFVPTNSGIFSRIVVSSQGSLPDIASIGSIYSQGNIVSSNNGFFGGNFSDMQYVQIGKVNEEVGIFDNEDSPLAVKTFDGQTFKYGSINVELVTGKVGIGIEAISPRGSLDVNGSCVVDDLLVVKNAIFDNSSLVINNGFIQVNSQAGSQYNTVITSSGININFPINSIIVSRSDSPQGFPYTPTSYLTAFPAGNRGDRIFGGSSSLQLDDIVLVTNFENKIQNGIYKVVLVPEDQWPVAGFPYYKLARFGDYLNGSTIPNMSRVRVLDGSSRLYTLNEGVIALSTIGIDELNFTLDSGSEVMTILSNKDVDFSGTISAQAKYFKIKHPDPSSKYKNLQYGSLESPYHGVRLTGDGQLKNGTCTIKLPDHLKYLIHDKNINIQLTNYGHHKILYVDKIDLKNNKFIVKGYRSKTGGPFKFFWCFTGIRKDVDPLILES
jgi:hypothetical protein